MRVLYASHTAVVSGAERALLDLLDVLPTDVAPVLSCPEGELAEQARARGVAWRAARPTRATLKLHPRRTPAALAELLGCAVALRAEARSMRAELIHANSTRAGLVAVLARRLGAPPVITHVHDRLPPGGVSGAVATFLRRGSSALVAISAHVERDLRHARGGAPIHLMFNPLDLARFDPSALTPASARARLGLDPRAPLLALVGQITPWKGHEDAVRAVALLRRVHPEVRLLIVGEPKFTSRETTYDNRAYDRGLRALVAQLGLDHAVAFWGERDDVPAIMRAVDVVLVPSWDEPLGRSMLEAMAMERAVVATARGGPAEIIEDGRTGRLVEPRDPHRLAAVIDEVLADDAARHRMGRAARTAVERFDRNRYAARMRDMYESLLGYSPPPPAPDGGGQFAL